MATILGANTLSSAYDVANGVRFEDGDNAKMSRSISGSPTDPEKYTFSCWIKRGNLTEGVILGEYANANFRAKFGFDSNHKLEYYQVNDGSASASVVTTQVFRDTTAWYHIVLAYDSSQGTAADRVKFYVNGTVVSSYSGTSYPAQDLDSRLNQASQTLVIGQDGNDGKDFDGYMCELVLIDGQALDATSFGEFDSDTPTTWKPKDPSSLTFGDDGFYLDFEDSGDLGDDESGNGNDFTESNLAATDQVTDTCTNNFATLNPLERSPNAITFTDGNTTASGTSGNSGRFTGGTYSPRKGKWWCELKVTVSGSYPIFGAIDADSNMKFDGTYFVGSESAPYQSGFAAFSNADVYHNDDNNYGNWQTYSTNDIIGMGIDMDASPPTLTFVKNGSNEETFNMETPNSGHYTFPAVGLYMAAAIAYFNFGSPPYAISSGNADQNGYGNFEYAPKTNYYSMCSKNIAEFG